MNIVDLSDSLVIVHVSIKDCFIPTTTKLANTKKVVYESINIPYIIGRDRKVTNGSGSNNLSSLVSSKSYYTSFFHDQIFEHMFFSCHVSRTTDVQIPGLMLCFPMKHT